MNLKNKEKNKQIKNNLIMFFFQIQISVIYNGNEM